MTLIRSIEDLTQARLHALEKQQEQAQNKTIHLKIGMASCSIAAGSADTLHAINRIIEDDNLPGVSASRIQVTQTGCIGLCALEPIVQIQIAGQHPVTYGKVTPDVIQRIFQNHIGKGLVVQEHVVENV
jgi:NADP-reducing hydrogenase subunit HndB